MAKPTFRATPSQVQVPATSANLGPGFDCLGLALQMNDKYVARVIDEPGLDIDVIGEGADNLPRNEKNLLVKAMFAGFDYLGGRPRGLAIRAKNVIPHGRGLGSSASAIVGGLALARSLVLGGEDKLTNEVMLQLATNLEGHPDNIAAAVLGGATIAWTSAESSHGVAIKVDPKIKALVFVPEAHLATSKARKLLPESIPHQDAVLNSSRTALLVHALAERPDLLFTATEDLLHQKYREEAMPKSIALVEKLRGAGLAAVVSGAGPSVMVLYSGAEDEIDQIQSVSPGFTAMKLAIAKTGVQ